MLTRKQAIEMMLRPPFEWQGMLDEMGQKDRLTLAEECSAMAERITALAIYAEERHGYGCGDQGHSSAAQKAIEAAKTSRKALGYSYPDNVRLSI